MRAAINNKLKILMGCKVLILTAFRHPRGQSTQIVNFYINQTFLAENQSIEAILKIYA